MNRRIVLALAPVPFVSLFSFPEVKPNNLFAENAVLQSDVDVPVWGTARDGEQMTVQFAGQRVTTTASDGHWMLRLKRIQANATPRTMTITGDNKLTKSNAVVVRSGLPAVNPIWNVCSVPRRTKSRSTTGIRKWRPLTLRSFGSSTELKGFTMAGDDKNFVPARAEIIGKTIVVQSDRVPLPVSVRYGWANVPGCKSVES